MLGVDIGASYPINSKAHDAVNLNESALYTVIFPCIPTLFDDSLTRKGQDQ
jgi:hypothetical protein